jgi:16S rRNA (guanine527-N7)-methyltransferase
VGVDVLVDPVGELDGDAQDRLAAYVGLLRSQAPPGGLVGFPPELLDEQLARSLMLLEALGRPERLVDVGSGAGLPGIPLMIALGNGVLVEPRRKAAAFLEGVIRQLDLPGRVEVCTAEEAGRGWLRDWSDAVVARAVGAPALAAELCAPLCAPGGVVVLTAAPDATTRDLPLEIRAALGVDDVQIRTVDARLAGALGDSGATVGQRLLMMRKVAPTPDERPRRPGTARRRPLGRDVRS